MQKPIDRESMRLRTERTRRSETRMHRRSMSKKAEKVGDQVYARAIRRLTVHPLQSLPLTALGNRNLVQYAVELRPDKVPFGALDMTKRTFLFCPHGSRRKLGFRMTEFEVPPTSAGGKAL